MNEETDNFFTKFGLELTEDIVEVGKTYPIYGMITEFYNDTPGKVEVQVNFKIRAKLNVFKLDQVELLKKRSLEPGIFVAKVLSNDDELVVECSTVIFGKASINEKQ